MRSAAIDYIKNHAGPRFAQIEFAFSFFQLSFNKTPDLTLLRVNLTEKHRRRTDAIGDIAAGLGL